jgi:hypothetical protein
MQMLGLQQGGTAQSHERLVQVSHLCSVRSCLQIQSESMTTCWWYCSVTLAGSKAVCTATHLRGCFGILQVVGGHAGTAWF